MYAVSGHILRTIDDMAADVDTVLAMASAYVEQGVRHLVCAPNRAAWVLRVLRPWLRCRSGSTTPVFLSGFFQRRTTRWFQILPPA